MSGKAQQLADKAAQDAALSASVYKDRQAAFQSTDDAADRAHRVIHSQGGFCSGDPWYDQIDAAEDATENEG